MFRVLLTPIIRSVFKLYMQLLVQSRIGMVSDPVCYKMIRSRERTALVLYAPDFCCAPSCITLVVLLITPTLFTQAFLDNVSFALTYEKFISFYGAQIFIILFTVLLAVLLKLHAFRTIKLSSPNILFNVFFFPCAIRSYKFCQLYILFSHLQCMLSASPVTFLFYCSVNIFIRLQIKDSPL
jgi:hypothetical protein